jgi:hypothetical protein
LVDVMAVQTQLMQRMVEAMEHRATVETMPLRRTRTSRGRSRGSST